MSSPYGKRYNDLVQQESEHKDVVISKLKASAFELHQTEKDCDDVSLRMTNLSHRINLLRDERAMDEKEYKQRNELSTKTIYNLKQEVQALEAELNNIEADISARIEDNDSMNRIVSSRSAELAKLKCELADLSDDNKGLGFENKELEKEINKLKREIEEDLDFSQEVNQKIEEATKRRDNNQKIIRELEDDEEKLLKQNSQLKAEQKELKLTTSDRVDAIKDAEYALAENRKDIATLEARIANQERAHEKLNKDIALGQQEFKEENARAAEQSAKINALEELNQEREDEILELRRQIAKMRKEEDTILDENFDLNNDIEVCNKHLDALTNEHHELLDEIEQFSQEDASVRRVLQREARVQHTKAKYEDKMRASSTAMNSSLQSPAKTGFSSATSKGAH